MLEMLRQPLEDKKVSIGRAAGSLTFPAAFMLIAAMNPCPCGFFGDSSHDCSCSPSAVSKYQKRLSGPLLDRFDIHITVPRVEYDKLADDRLAEPSSAIRARVEAARQMQQGRFEHLPHITCNSDMGVEQVRLYCKLNPTSQQLMKAAMKQMNLSARAYHRTLKLARTIADLAGAKEIDTPHVAEALQYRRRE
jgi:magnesium chelatase family protein